MLFKHDHIEKELEGACPALQAIARTFEELSMKLGIEPVITRILDPVTGESGVHQDYRAIDFRNEMGVGGPRLYTDEQAELLVKQMNLRFPRKDGLKTCIHHAFINHQGRGGRAPYHFHTQIPYWAKQFPGPYPH